MIAIIGHGPSMLNSGLGDKINSYDTVIRQKYAGGELIKKFPNDFGKKVSYICGSWTIRNSLFWHSAPVWVFCDSRHENIELSGSEPFTILLRECNYWNNIYRNLRSSEYARHEKMTVHKTSSDIGHNHMSCGLHTIIYACHILRPKAITLFGFDNLKTGQFTWSLTRGQQWSEYPDHRWDTENIMLKEISKYYDVEFNFKP